jgi:hypothetical protein
MSKPEGMTIGDWITRQNALNYQKQLEQQRLTPKPATPIVDLTGPAAKSQYSNTQKTNVGLSKSLNTIYRGEALDALAKTNAAIKSQQNIIDVATSPYHNPDPHELSMATDNLNKMISQRDKLNTYLKSNDFTRIQLNAIYSNLDIPTQEYIAHPNEKYSIIIDGKTQTFNSYDDAVLAATKNQKFTVTDAAGNEIEFPNKDAAQNYREALEEANVHALENPTSLSGKLWKESENISEKDVAYILGLPYSPKGLKEIEAILAGSGEDIVSPLFDVGTGAVNFKTLETLQLSPDKKFVGELTGIAAETVANYFALYGVSAVAGAALGAAGSAVSKIPKVGELAYKAGQIVSTTSVMKALNTFRTVVEGSDLIAANAESVPAAFTKVAAALDKIPLAAAVVTGTFAAAEYNKLLKISQTNSVVTALGQEAIDIGGLFGMAQGFGYGFAKGKSAMTYLNKIIKNGPALSAEEITELTVLTGKAKYPGFTEAGLTPSEENFRGLSVNYTPPEYEIPGKVSLYTATPDGSLLKSLEKVGVVGGEEPLLWGAPSVSKAFMGVGNERLATPGIPNFFSNPNILQLNLDDVLATDISKMDRAGLNEIYSDIAKTGRSVGIMPLEQGLESQAVVGAGQIFSKVGETVYVKMNGNWFPMNRVIPVMTANTMGIADDAVIKLSEDYANEQFLPVVNAMVSSQATISAPIGSVTLSSSDISKISEIISEGSLSNLQISSVVSALSKTSAIELISDLPSDYSNVAISELYSGDITSSISKDSISDISDVTSSGVGEISEPISGEPIGSEPSGASPASPSEPSPFEPEPIPVEEPLPLNEKLSAKETEKFSTFEKEKHFKTTFVYSNKKYEWFVVKSKSFPGAIATAASKRRLPYKVKRFSVRKLN